MPFFKTTESWVHRWSHRIAKLAGPGQHSRVITYSHPQKRQEACSLVFLEQLYLENSRWKGGSQISQGSRTRMFGSPIALLHVSVKFTVSEKGRGLFEEKMLFGSCEILMPNARKTDQIAAGETCLWCSAWLLWGWNTDTHTQIHTPGT